ncbi:MAG TPA: DUF3592 domain-containing protein [Patescibacteria group bacterium]|nr:DUF3592 domain-containing protein [Patescibacteria group bacterium]
MEVHINLNPKHGPRHSQTSPDQKPASPAVLLGIGLFFILVLAGISALVLSSTRKQVYAHDHFKEIQAQVIESHVRSQYHGNQGRRNRSSTITISNNSRDTTYSAVITYRYSVNGQNYTSDRYWYAGSGSGSMAAAQNTVDKYPAGAQTTAYYNPDKPEEAVLDNSAPSTTIPYAGLGFMWFVVLLIIGKCVLGYRDSKKL